jgi:hypothetical protein
MVMNLSVPYIFPEEEKHPNNYSYKNVVLVLYLLAMNRKKNYYLYFL